MEIIIQGTMIGASVIICILAGEQGTVCAALGICVSGVFMTSIVSWWRRERQIAELTMYLTRLQDELSCRNLAMCGRTAWDTGERDL